MAYLYIKFLLAYQLFILVEYLVYWQKLHDKLNVISILIFTWINYISDSYILHDNSIWSIIFQLY